ncbi:MAG TPA: biopolymer transporter ExbD [Mariprofundaceae bacterium]|nr:biopolymer transporter ExbD [Mariprofundaceae bacterium]
MKLNRARGYRKGRIEIIPMIDVMFFLLATFMLASLSMQNLHSLRVDLPQGKAEQLKRPLPVTLTVTHDSRILINSQPVTLDTLAGALRSRGESQHSVVVSADAAAPQGLVVQAMLRARQAGVEHFLIAVRHD